MAIKDIKPGDLIISIPQRFFIDTSTVFKSDSMKIIKKLVLLIF